MKNGNLSSFIESEDCNLANKDGNDIAIVGMACRFPSAENYESYWSNLVEGILSVQQVPDERWYWSSDNRQPDHEGNRWGAFIDKLECFDASFFGISARESEIMDPQQRIMLELAWECLEDAAITAESLSDTDVGVYVGVFNHDYKELLEKYSSEIAAHFSTGTASAIIPNRISHFFNFKGPSIPVDSACSSSLHALHLAIQSIRSAECSAVLVGGVNLLLTSTRHRSFEKSGMLSASGQCKSFSAGSDGYVRGEGAGFVLLKPLSKARFDGDHIRAVIKGSAVNHVGKSKTLTYPSAESQAEVIVAALNNANVSCEQLAFIETHGTGTPKGDPIEIEGLLLAFKNNSGKSSWSEPYCALGSAKPNIGHLESAAGMAGLIKTVLSLEKKFLPFLPNFESLNPRINLKDGPFYLSEKDGQQDKATQLKSTSSIFAGVSSFGFGGTNAHIILEQFIDDRISDNDEHPYYLFCLSAKNKIALEKKIADLHQWLIVNIDSINLKDISATLLLGKDHFKERIAFVAADKNELLGIVNSLLINEISKDYFSGTVDDLNLSQTIQLDFINTESCSNIVWREKYFSLAERFVQGATIDGYSIFNRGYVRRQKLPSYPFQKTPYWFSFGEKQSIELKKNISSAAVDAVSSIDNSTNGEEILVPVWRQLPYLPDTQNHVGLSFVPKKTIVFGATEKTEKSIANVINNAIYISPELIDNPDMLACELLAAGAFDHLVFFCKRKINDISNTDQLVECKNTGIHALFRLVKILIQLGFNKQKLSWTIVTFNSLTLKGDSAINSNPIDASIHGLAGSMAREHARWQVSVIDADLEVQFDSAKLYQIYPIVQVGPQVIRNHVWYQRELIRLPKIRQEKYTYKKDGIYVVIGGAGIVGQAWSAWMIKNYNAKIIWIGRRKKNKDIEDAINNVALKNNYPLYISADAADEIALADALKEIKKSHYQVNGIVHSAMYLEDKTIAKMHEQDFTLALKVKIDVTFSVAKVFEKEPLDFIIYFSSMAAFINNPEQSAYCAGCAFQDAYADAQREINLQKLKSPLIKIMNWGYWNKADNLQSDVYLRLGEIGIDLITPPEAMKALNCLMLGPLHQIAFLKTTKPIFLSGTNKSDYLELKAFGCSKFSSFVYSEMTSDWVAAGKKNTTLHSNEIRDEVIEINEDFSRNIISYHIGTALQKYSAEMIGDIRPNILEYHIGSESFSKDDFLSITTKLDANIYTMAFDSEVCTRKAKKYFPENFPTFNIVTLDDVELFEREFFNGSDFDMVVIHCHNNSYPNSIWMRKIKSCMCADAVLVVKQYNISPLIREHISTPQWQRLLLVEGYQDIHIFTAANSTQNYQITLAKSDGVVSCQIPALRNSSKVFELHNVDNKIEKSSAYLNAISNFQNSSQSSDFLANNYVGSMSSETIFEIVPSILSQALKGEVVRSQYNEAFADYGVDSIIGVQFVGELNKKLGIKLDATVIYDYNTVNRLCDHLKILLSEITSHSEILNLHENQVKDFSSASLLSSDAKKSEQYDDSKNAFNRKSIQSDIAIVGISGRFPGAENLDALWARISNGDDLVEIVSRWDLDKIYKENKCEAFCNIGGFLSDIDKFDASFFNISSLEAIYMDPLQRVFLEQAWNALENSGYVGDILKEVKCGVFVGSERGDYSQLFTSKAPAQALWGNAGSVNSARVAYHLDLHGPTITVDTACSSSLAAVHYACQSLWMNEVDIAVAGGVAVQSTPNIFLTAGKAGMLSKRGRCFAFDSRADGFVPSEGAGAIVIRHYQDALKDGDYIYAIIRASGINQDGSTNGITAPSVKSQQRLTADLYEKFAIDPQDIQLVEAHGTGTELGDPIEFSALCKTFSKSTEMKNYCALGSIKSNIGHTLAASGIAGLLKIVLALKHKKIPPAVNYQKNNPHISLEDSPFYINEMLKDWETAVAHRDGVISPRLAALNSFGMSGTNVHLIIEEAPARAVRDTGASAYLIVLSAQSFAQLQLQVEQLANHVDTTTKISIGNVSYTLLNCRKHFNHRLACVVEDIADLLDTLRGWLKLQKIGRVFVCNTLDRDIRSQTGIRYYGEQCIDNCIATDNTLNYREQLSVVAELFVQGYELSYKKLFKGLYFKEPLPTYPFHKQSYWLSELARKPFATKELSIINSLHPFLDSNTSNTGELRYSKCFNRDDLYIADHQINGAFIIPPAICIEMARAAILNIIEEPFSTVTQLVIENIAWASHVNLEDQTRTLHIAVFPQGNSLYLFEIYTDELDSHNKKNRRIHCQGKIKGEESELCRKVKISDIASSCQLEELSGQRFYQLFDSIGMKVGSSLNTIERLWCGEGQALVKIVRKDEIDNVQESLILHPGTLEAMFHSAMVFSFAGSNYSDTKVVLPLSIEKLSIFESCPKEAWAWIKVSKTTSHDISKIYPDSKFNIDLYNEEGSLCIKLEGYTRSDKHTLNNIPNPESHAQHFVEPMQTLFFEPGWVQAELKSLEKIISHDSKRIVVLCGIRKSDAEQLKLFSSADKYLVLAESEQTISQSFTNSCLNLIDELKILLLSKPVSPVLLQLVISIQDDLDPRTLFQGLYGVLLTANAENPLINGQVIELYGVENPTEIEAILLNNSTAINDKYIRYEGNKRSVGYWKEIGRQSHEDMDSFSPWGTSLPWKSEGTYLITGGTGGLGLIIAREIIKSVSKPIIILCGRSALDESRREILKQLNLLGGRVTYRQLDIGNTKAVTECINDIVLVEKHLHGIIHCAGVVNDSFIIKKTLSGAHEVLIPKVDGLINLDEASADVALDFLITFSTTNVLGSVGQADYSAANGFMDRFAHYRNKRVNQGQRKGHSLSINWPLWKNGGMGFDSFGEQQWRERGLIALENQMGISAFYQAYNSKRSQVMIFAGNYSLMQTYLNVFTDNNSSRLHRDFTINQKFSLTQISDKQKISELPDNVERFLKQLLSEVIGVTAVDISSVVPMERFGIDSIMVMAMTKTLEKIFGPLSKTLFFEYKNIKELAEYFILNFGDEVMCKAIGHAVAGSTSDTLSIVDQPSMPTSGAARLESFRLQTSNFNQAFSQPKEQAMDIAIIGLSGSYPQSRTIDDLWQNLKLGRDCITEVPVSRWDYQHHYSSNKNEPGKIYGKWGGFIEGVDEFDPLFFNISPREAEHMDPQERLFLQCSMAAIEDAGYTRESLATKLSDNGDFGIGTNIGVYVGVTYEEYQLYGAQQQQQGNNVSLGGSPASIANRVSYYCNFHGPSMAVDSMCSSSLSAIHLACNSLQNGSCRLAFAGGVNLNIHPNKYFVLSKSQFLSSKGRCESFGEGGDGYVPSEGVGVVLLKPKAEALKDGDHIYGVIRACHINHGGKTNGYTIPNPQAQSALIKQAYEKAGIDPDRISYIEAHGTGTSLGDPIEISALVKAFGDNNNRATPCIIGSVKSNIGHCESAAGIAGLTKVLLQFKHQMLVPSLHAEKLNPYIDFTNTPFHVQQKLESWECPYIEVDGLAVPQLRIAGVSSFGAGGANAHLIVEEYIEQRQNPTVGFSSPGQATIIVLSAKSELQLIQRVSDLFRYLEQDFITEKDLASVAYTLQVGREAMPARIALLVYSLDELKNILKTFILDINSIDGSCKNILTAQQAMHDDFIFDDDFALAIDAWIIKKKYKKLIDIWLKGWPIDWDKLYSEEKPFKVSMPTYPFKRESYWAPGTATVVEKNMMSSEPVLFNCEKSSSPKDYIEPKIHLLAPVWEHVSESLLNFSTFDSQLSRSIIIKEDNQNFFNIEMQRLWDEVSTKDYCVGALDLQSENIQQLLESYGKVDRIFWFIPQQPMDSLFSDNVLQAHNNISAKAFRLIKALINSQYKSSQLTITLVTVATQKVFATDKTNPVYASLHGLFGVLAKEYSHWNIQLLDLESIYDLRLDIIVKAPIATLGATLVFRDGCWLQQKFTNFIAVDDVDAKPYKIKGVYIIIGGAGGIGEAWSEHLVRNYQAQIIWIGRRKINSAIEAKIKKLSAFGPAPVYYSADASEFNQLSDIHDQVKQRYGKIDGIIHSALGDFDTSLANMSESQFDAGLISKVDICVRIAQVFKNEKLDFILFFSALASLIREHGKGSYVAGGCFEDAYALELAGEMSTPIKIVNWGYWGSIGSADLVPQSYKNRLSLQGIDAISASEAFDALAKLHQSPINQLVVLKILQEKLHDFLSIAQTTATYSLPQNFNLVDAVIDSVNMPNVANVRAEVNQYESFETIEDALGLLLFSIFHSMGLVSVEGYKIEEMKSHLDESYYVWLEQAVTFLNEMGFLAENNGHIYATRKGLDNLNNAWQNWNNLSAVNDQTSKQSAQLRLVESTLNELPKILTGERFATEIMFPDSSVTAVGGVYQKNPVADYYNEGVAQSILAVLHKCMQQEQYPRLRILEIGAGTGGTSAKIFERLQPFSACIEQYCYTDISKAFLFHAEDNYKSIAPYLHCQLLNIEKNIVEQGIQLGSYDIVVATNVLHATKNIRQTLRNAKSALRSQGLLLLNEMSRNSLLAHLTFGLLEGWWLHEDKPLRLKNCPALSSDSWEKVLLGEGFTSINFPLIDGHDLGQQLVVAASDGLLTHMSGSDSATISSTSKKIDSLQQEHPNQIEQKSSTINSSTSENVSSAITYDYRHIQNIVIEKLSAALRMKTDAIDFDVSFADYGLDSIIGVNLLRNLNDAFNLNMDSTILFDYSSVNKLTDYLCNELSSLDISRDPVNENNSRRIQEINRQTESLAVGKNFSSERDNDFSKPEAAVDISISDRIKNIVHEKFCDAVRIKSGEIDSAISFADYGLDSILGVNLVQQLNTILNINLSTIVLFDHSTVDKLTSYIVKEIVKQNRSEQFIIHSGDKKTLPIKDSSPAIVMAERKITGEKSAFTTKKPEQIIRPQPQPVKNNRQDIAIIGMSCRIGAANSPEALWEVLANGESLIENLTRWDISSNLTGDIKQNYCPWGSFLQDIDKFDPAFFNISGLEARYMDPMQRLFLEESWHALEDAGYAGELMLQKNCGVYVGCTAGDYLTLFDTHPPAQSTWGISNSALPARISYYLDLKGPAIAIDTACSSSLVAVHIACQGLWSGEVDMALAGGVSVRSTRHEYMAMSRAGMLSPTGHCYTFDERADGFVPGEGVGVVLLKLLQAAIAEGDNIHAVMKASGINQDGATNGIGAPSVKSQEDLQSRIYDTFAIDPQDIQMVEAHGTGTILGDPIEFSALTKSFRRRTAAQHYCAIGSIKTNVGHTTTAAGISGLLKIILSLKNKMIPPSLNFNKGNPNIKFEGSPFYVNTKLTDWPTPKNKSGEFYGRLAVVSSFGMSGTNAHLVVQEAPQYERTSANKKAYLFVLSSRSHEQLLIQIKQLIGYCKNNRDADCGNISFTLLVGRKHLLHRFACVANSLSDLQIKMSEWIEKGQAPYVFCGALEKFSVDMRPALLAVGQQAVDQAGTSESSLDATEALGVIADLFIQGYKLNYSRIFKDSSYSKLSLPTYPFAKERYWLDQKVEDIVAETVISNTVDNTVKAGAQAKANDAANDTAQGGLLWYPKWQSAPLATSSLTVSNSHAKAQRIVVLCELDDIVAAEVTRSMQTCSCYSFAKTTEDISVRYINHAESMLALFKQIILEKSSVPVVVQFLIGSISNTDNDILLQGINSLLLTAEKESPILYTQFIDLGEQLDSKKIVDIINKNYNHLHIKQVRYRKDERYTIERRLLNTNIDENVERIMPWKDHGIYLITGGAGGIGLSIASEISRKVYGAQLILCGRSALSPTKKQALEKLQYNGTRIVYREVDVEDQLHVDILIESIIREFGNLEGIVHCAGVTQDGFIGHKNPASSLSVFSAKVSGTLNLDRATQYLPVEFIILCSSLASVEGSEGQANYSCANGFLDAFSSYRNKLVVAGSRQGYCISINWPLWVNGGMRPGDRAEARLEAMGLLPITDEQAMDYLYQAYGSGQDQVVVLSGIVETLKQTFLVNTAKFMQAANIDSQHYSIGSFANTLPVAQPNHDDVLTKLREIIADEIGFPVHRVKPLTSFLEFGIDSIIAIKITDKLEQAFGSLSKTLFYEYENIQELCDYFFNTYHNKLNRLMGQNDNLSPEKVSNEPYEIVSHNAGDDNSAAYLRPSIYQRTDNEVFLRKNLHGTEFFLNHCVNGTRVLPGVMYLELAYIATLTAYGKAITEGYSWGLKNCVWIRPMEVAHAQKVIFINLKEAQNEEVSYQVFSSEQMDECHAQGFLHRQKLTSVTQHNIDLLKSKCQPEQIEISRFYELYQNMGIDHGMELRCVKELYVAKNYSLAKLELPLATIHGDSVFILHPSLLDSALQATLGLQLFNSNVDHIKPALPFALESLDIYRELPGNVWVWISRRETLATKSDIEKLDIDICDSYGNLCVRMLGFSVRSLNPSQLPEIVVSAGKVNKSILNSNKKIAIVSMAGRYPGARDVAEFWDNLINGRDSVTHVPEQRWQADKYLHMLSSEKPLCQWGGFLDGIDEFDPEFFNIFPKDAKYVDPQVRLFLQTVWELLECGGYTRENLRLTCDSMVGVFVGSSYQLYQANGDDVLSQALTSSSANCEIVNRVSQYFDFRGPSIAIDTMCSSSLTAVHMACRALQNNECSLAVAGGVNILLTPKKYLGVGMAGILASRKDSRSFADGDGYIPAEAVGAVLLKPLQKAIEDGDNIQAVILSSHQNHSGQSNGYLTPNPRMQEKLIIENFKKANIDIETIGYVEAWASGCSLADAAEFTALKNAFISHSNAGYKTVIGSVKSNIGHPEAASGIAQLTKTVLQMVHGQFPATIYAEHINQGINFSNSPFQLLRAASEWQRKTTIKEGKLVELPRRATVGGFGAGGSNVHLIIEEYLSANFDSENNIQFIEDEQQAEFAEEHVLIFSAKNKRQLKYLVGKMLHFWNLNVFPLASIAYTLQMGREHMPSRLAIVVKNFDQINMALQEFLLLHENHASAYVPMFYGDVEQDDSALREICGSQSEDLIASELLYSKNFIDIAKFWASGGDFSWSKLYEGKSVQKIVLPTYPFIRNKYWVAVDAVDVGVANSMFDKAKVSENDYQHITEYTPLKSIKFTVKEQIFQFLINYFVSEFGIHQEQIKAHKNIYDYGLDSISTMKLMNAIKLKFSINLSWKDMLSINSLDVLASFLSDSYVGNENNELNTEINSNTMDVAMVDEKSELLEKFIEGLLSEDEIKDAIKKGLVV